MGISTDRSTAYNYDQTYTQHIQDAYGQLVWYGSSTQEGSMKRPAEFYSEGVKLRGDIYRPDDLQAGEKRPGIVLCHGYTGVKDLYLPDTAQTLNHAGYVVMTFDYKGWGESDGPRSRLAPYSRVLDVQAAMTFPEPSAGSACRPSRDLWHELRRRDGVLGWRCRPAGEMYCQRGRDRPWGALDAQRAASGRVG